MKTKILFVCQNCGAQSPRWSGKCPQCESWNTFVEEETLHLKLVSSKMDQHTAPMLLSEVQSSNEKRFLTSIKEFDRVMGGGIVYGEVTLIGGDPGIGKCTLSLQVGCSLSQMGSKVLYVTGEESVSQTNIRAKRLFNKDLGAFYIVNQIDLKIIF